MCSYLQKPAVLLEPYSASCLPSFCDTDQASFRDEPHWCGLHVKYDQMTGSTVPPLAALVSSPARLVVLKMRQHVYYSVAERRRGSPFGISKCDLTQSHACLVQGKPLT